MRTLFHKLWHDDAGFIFSVELALIFVILLLGVVAGLTALRGALVTELYEQGNSILAINQSYTISGIQGYGGSSGASGAFDIAGTLNAPSCVTGVTSDINVAVPCNNNSVPTP